MATDLMITRRYTNVTKSKQYDSVGNLVVDVYSNLNMIRKVQTKILT